MVRRQANWAMTRSLKQESRMHSEDHLRSAAAMAHYNAQKIAMEMGSHGHEVSQTMDGPLGHLQTEWIVPALLTDESLLAMAQPIISTPLASHHSAWACSPRASRRTAYRPLYDTLAT